MKSSIKENFNPSKIVTEFLVIVIGVFVAVALESWWSEREERKFEQEIRQDMLAEFESNITILENDIALNIDANEHFYQLTKLSDKELLELSDTNFSENFASFNPWAVFDPIIGNLQALIDSGNLSVISDRKLRFLLSRWSGNLKVNIRFSLQASNIHSNLLEPIRNDALSDLIWTDKERRKLQDANSTMALFHTLVLDSQKELLLVAKDVYSYLSSGS